MDKSIFIDWLSMSQMHFQGGLPVVNSGCVWAVDEGGEIEWTTSKHLESIGSYDTKLRLRCDGQRVEFSGNIGRFNRPDNVFGFDFAECVRRVNRFLNTWNLPPFSPGSPRWVTTGNKEEQRLEFTGAVITRVDVTQNICLWSDENARLFLNHLSSLQRGRVKVGVSPDGNSVLWGYGSKYSNHIAYLKVPEMLRHMKRGSVLPEVFNHISGLGVIRLESKYMTRFCTQNGLRFLAEVDMAKIINFFRHDRQKVMFNTVEVSSYDDIPQPFRGTAKDWRDGVDLKSTMKQNTYYRHRRELKKYGIDIAVSSNVKQLHHVKVVELNPTALLAPDWYRDKFG